jgi:hypothetical protein
MNRQISIERLLALYVPWVLSLLVISDPALSYMIAWLGSFFIFFGTLSGWVTPLPSDRSFAEQLMRPILLVQIIFAGYTCCTSIFYYISILGYDNFEAPSNFFLLDIEKLKIAAQCQRLYVLGHAAFVTGIILFMKYPIKQKVRIDIESIADLLFKSAIITLPVSILFLKVPGLSQFSNQFSSFSFIAGTLALAFAIPEKKKLNTVICVILYLSNFYSALTSGFKEPIIISVMVLGVFLYPSYKKVVLATFVPLLCILFLLLPTYANFIRANVWSGQESAENASELALQAALDQNEEKGDTNWSFFVYRLSEIHMFTIFLESTPDNIPYYGFELLKQSATAVVPRIFWPAKPNTESMVMERVYAAGVVNRNANVSAKPAYIVDAYLWGRSAVDLAKGGTVVWRVLAGYSTYLFGLVSDLLAWLKF